MSTPTVLLSSSGATRSIRPSPFRSAAPIQVGHLHVRLGQASVIWSIGPASPPAHRAVTVGRTASHRPRPISGRLRCCSPIAWLN